MKNPRTASALVIVLLSAAAVTAYAVILFVRTSFGQVPTRLHPMTVFYFYLTGFAGLATTAMIWRRVPSAVERLALFASAITCFALAAFGALHFGGLIENIPVMDWFVILWHN